MVYKMNGTQNGLSIVPTRSIRFFILLLRLIVTTSIYYGFNLDSNKYYLGFIFCYIAVHALTLHLHRFFLRKYYRKIYTSL